MHLRTVIRLTPARHRRALLRIEILAERALPSVTVAEPVFPTVMAGDQKGLPSDAPTQHVDPNTADSPFAGVGSIVVSTAKSDRLGSGAAIGSRYVLTAAHVVDLNNDGKFDAKDSTTGIYFVLNVGGDATQKIAVSQVDIDPFYTGFNHPSVNDDIAVLTLAEDLPSGVPTYSVGADLSAGTIITFVGYGRSGDGLKGYTTSASPIVKRVGQNVVDAFYGQDDKGQPEMNEVYRFDFDGPKGNGPLGAGTLGNSIESQLGTGDSGGPAFVLGDGGYTIVGVNTFVQGGNAPRFGSMGGGAIVSPYLQFIYSIIGSPQSGDGPLYDATGDLDAEITTVRVPNFFIPFLGPAFIPSKGGAGVGVRAKPVSGEFATALQPTVTSGFGTFGPQGDPSLNSDSNADDKSATALIPDGLSYEFVRRTDDPLLLPADPTAIGFSAGLDVGVTSLLSIEGILTDE